MAVIIFGGSGMLGQELRRAFSARGGVIAPTHDEVDIADLASVRRYIDDRSGTINAVINAAGAIEARGAGFLQYARTNALGAGYVAKACRDAGLRLIHVSTDCVFSGKRTNSSYVETDKTDAESSYGKSKATGEAAVLSSGADALVVRCSFIGPSHGFLRWLREAGESGEPIELWRNASWSGTTAGEAARGIERLTSWRIRKVIHMTTGELYSKAMLAETCWKLGLAKRVESTDTDLPVINRWLTSTHGNVANLRPLVDALEEYK